MTIKKIISFASILLVLLAIAFADEKIKTKKVTSKEKEVKAEEEENNEFKGDMIESKLEVSAEASIGEEGKKINQNTLIGAGTIKIHVERKITVTSDAISIISDNINFKEDNFKVISIENLKKTISKNQVVIIDFNGKESFAKGHIPNAINGYANSFEADLSKDKKILVVVYFPLEDFNAWIKVIKIIQSGYNNICYLNGGVESWEICGGNAEISSKNINEESKDIIYPLTDKLKNLTGLYVKVKTSFSILEQECNLVNSGFEMTNPLDLISTSELKKAISNNSVLIIDLNSFENFTKGHLPNAISGYSKDIGLKISANKNKKIVVYFPMNDFAAWTKVLELDNGRSFGLNNNFSYFSSSISGWLASSGEKLEK